MQTGSSTGSGGGGHAAATYHGLRRRPASTALGEINVTPLVDVVLVLLLVFMVTAPMMTRGIDLTLPTANLPDITPQDRVTVQVNAKGQVFVDGKPVNMLLLEDHLRDMVEGRGLKVVYLSADESLSYGRVIAVMDKVKRAGVELVGLNYQLPPQPGGQAR
jgi:biopolymer transport protein TolR